MVALFVNGRTLTGTPENIAQGNIPSGKLR